MPKVKLKKGQLVHVLWEDHYSHSYQGWQDPGTVGLDPVYCETVGWVVDFNKDRLLLCSTIQIADDGKSFVYGGQYKVRLRKCIKKIKLITQFKGKI